MASDDELPDVARILAGILRRVPRQSRPLLIALAERRAADRYRAWAGASGPERRAALLACAAREEDIARRVEELYPDAGDVQRRLLDGDPDLEDVNRRLFAGRPVEQQLRIQAQGERLGAGTWRAFAEHTEDGEARRTFLACAKLEEESAEVLERMLAGDGDDDVAAHILALERAALDRWGRGDPSGFLEISAPDVVYFDPFVERRLDGLDGLAAYYERIRGRVRITSWEMPNPRVQRIGEAAVLTFNFVSHGGSEDEYRWNCTEVYRRDDDRWRIVHTHWSFTKVGT